MVLWVKWFCAQRSFVGGDIWNVHGHYTKISIVVQKRSAIVWAAIFLPTAGGQLQINIYKHDVNLFQNAGIPVCAHGWHW